MRPVFVFLFAGLLCAQPPRQGQGWPGTGRSQQTADRAPTPPEDLGSISGQVVNASTGEPLKKATLSLRPIQGGGMETPSSTSTDTAGNFSIKNLEPGSYRLGAERNGFVRQEYGARRPGRGGTALTVEKAQKLSNIVLRMTPHSVISGRIADDEGDPLANVSVQVMRMTYFQGRRQMTSAGSAQSNDLGEYRIHGIPPGKYFLTAVMRPSGRFGGQADTGSPEEAADETFAPTYFPGTSDPAAAVPLDLAMGSDLRGMSLTLTKTRTVRVRGKVAGPADTARARGMVVLLPRSAAGLGFFGAGRNTASWNPATGAFAIRGVTPGSYTLIAQLQERGQRMTARAPVEVGNSHVDGVVLQIAPGADLSGSIKIEGQGETPLSGVSVSLVPRDIQFFGGSANGRANADGTFTLAGVSPDNYLVRVTGLPAAAYLKSARFGQVDALDKGLDLTQGIAGALEVVVSTAGGQIDGVALNDKQEPAVGAQVVLAPPPDRRTQTQLFKKATADQSGHYQIQGVAPGDYELYAFEDLEQGAEQDADYLKQFEKSAEKVTVRENSRESKQLKQVPAEDAPLAPQGGK